LTESGRKEKVQKKANGETKTKRKRRMIKREKAENSGGTFFG